MTGFAASCLMALLLEIAGLLVAVRIQPSVAQLLYFLLAHLLACLALCHCLPAVLAVRRAHGLGDAKAGRDLAAAVDARADADIRATESAANQVDADNTGMALAGSAGRSLGWMVFMVCFFIPGCGMSGVLLALLPALCWPAQRQHGPSWQRASVPAFATEPAVAAEQGAQQGSRTAASLRGILEHGSDPHRRLRALIATLSLTDLHAAPLLRIALRDGDDEVRLLSYALITRKEKTLEEQVQHATQRLHSADAEQRLAHQRALAHHFWELGNIAGDADGARQFHELARSHAGQCLDSRGGDGVLQFLLGRIELKLQRNDAAATAFQQAVEAGVDQARVRPFLAELAFLGGHFADVGALLAPDTKRGLSAPLASQHGYWKALSR